MADCVLKILEGLNPSCQALKKQGGIKKRIYVANFDDVVITYDGDGYIDSITLAGSPAPQMYKFIGKDFKNSSNFEGTVGENLNTIRHNINLLLYYFTPAERASIESLYNAEKLIAIVEGNGGEGKAAFEVFGVLNGLKSSALTGGSGVNLQDSTALTITLSGDETELPKVLKSGTYTPDEEGYIQENTEYLDDLSA